jgi:hypothetical protein
MHHVRTQQAKVPSEESEQLVDRLAAKNAEVVVAMEKIYFENLVGKFKVIAEYHSTSSATWVGTISSQELVVDMKDKGAFFDSLKTP